MAHLLRATVAVTGNLGLLPIAHRKVQNPFVALVPAFNMLFWPPQASGIPMVHRPVDETFIHIKHKFKNQG